MTPRCANCHGEGWVCENHPSTGWPSKCSCGAGEPCPMCNPGALPFCRVVAVLQEMDAALAEYDDGAWGHEGMPGDEVGSLHSMVKRALAVTTEPV